LGEIEVKSYKCNPVKGSEEAPQKGKIAAAENQRHGCKDVRIPRKPAFIPSPHYSIIPVVSAAN